MCQGCRDEACPVRAYAPPNDSLQNPYDPDGRPPRTGVRLVRGGRPSGTRHVPIPFSILDP